MVAISRRASSTLNVPAPVKVAAEVLPRLLGTLVWDAAKRELRQVPAGSAAPAVAAAARDSVVRTAVDSGTPALRVSASRPAARRAVRTVVVDAGHGGPDNGMRGPIRGGPQIREKDVTLEVARRYADVLRQRGLKVLMTR